MTDKKLELFCQELVWFDDMDRGSHFAVVLAPDKDTAERLIAAEMLEAGSDNLFELYGHEEDGEPKTLARYYREHGELGAWGDIGGTACPNCTSHAGRETGEHFDMDGATRAIHECGACGFRWAPMGFGQKRQELEAAALEAIAGLDEVERESATDPDYDGDGNLKAGVDNT